MTLFPEALSPFWSDSAGEEFTALKGLVQKADASELSAQLARAPLAWEPLGRESAGPQSRERSV